VPFSITVSKRKRARIGTSLDGSNEAFRNRKQGILGLIELLTQYLRDKHWHFPEINKKSRIIDTHIVNPAWSVHTAWLSS
jgi:hypothetical protein